MILATLKNQSPDGGLLLIDQSHQWALELKSFHPFLESLRLCIENWSVTAPLLKKYQRELESAVAETRSVNGQNLIPVPWEQLHSPLPRSFAWLDGSAYINHIVLVRKARNAALPPNLHTVPLMYQGGSDTFLPPTADIPLLEMSYGLDFESEVAVITDFVPMGTKAHEAGQYIRLVMLVNDVTLRGLVPEELAQGFGFMQSKPSTAFSPLVLTVDELGDYWREGRIHLPLSTYYNGELFGQPNAGEMHFSFPELIEHAARTRNLSAGTIIGSGTVSNEDLTKGSSCLAEKRMIEQIYEKNIKTPFMKDGDQICIFMKTPEGRDLFGSIRQKVVQQ